MAVPGVVTPVFTVPAGQTWLCKLLRVINGTAALAVTYRLEVITPDGSNRLTADRTLAGNSDESDESWYAFDPGCQLRLAHLAGTTNLQVWAFGAKLNGAA